MLERLSDKEKSELFDHIFNEYVVKPGLGGMSKTDFDAYFLWQVSNSLGIDDVFQLSQIFKVKESRVKSLLHSADLKFNDLSHDEAWHEILELLVVVPFDLTKFSEGKVSFQLKKIVMYRWIQAEFRKHGYSTTFNASSENVTLSLDGFIVVLAELERNSSADKQQVALISTKLNKLIEETSDKSKIKKVLQTIKESGEFMGSLSVILGYL